MVAQVLGIGAVVEGFGCFLDFQQILLLYPSLHPPSIPFQKHLVLLISAVKLSESMGFLFVGFRICILRSIKFYLPLIHLLSRLQVVCLLVCLFCSSVLSVLVGLCFLKMSLTAISGVWEKSKSRFIYSLCHIYQ